MIIALASDHAGFEQKQEIATWLTAQGYTVKDFGPRSDDRVDYPDYAQLVASCVADQQADAGVLVCGTGIGMAIAANKIKGIRAAALSTPEFARLAREHNNLNVLALSGRFVELETNIQVIKVFLETPFAQGRHAHRISKISALEA